MDHDIAKQPKWVQEHIADLEHKIAALQELKTLHAILCDADRDWFAVPNNEDDFFILWRLHKDKPHAICSIGPGDLLFVGRKIKESTL